jgi:Protein phosphatase 2C
MPMSADSSQRPPRDTQETWLALTASHRGAAHHASGLPNQDAVQACLVAQDVVIAAVADGHGHYRHFRSARGAALAVAVACEAAAELGARLDEFEAAAQLESEALGQLVPAVAERWRAAVRDDLAAQPFTDEEQAARAAGDDALIAYGSTLLLAVAGRRWLVLVQIGDGDIVGIQPGGQALLAVPADPSLDGRQTTSLCGPRAEEQFRAAAVDVASTALLGVLLATDGYGNSQVADPWADAVSADLAGLIAGRPPHWLADQLPVWAGRCASAEGSADDTTIALLIAPPSLRGSEASTVPVADEPAVPPEAPTVPVGVAPEAPSAGQRAGWWRSPRRRC